MGKKKPTLYLETSVVSYFAARPSRDLVVAAHQAITGEWWETHLDDYRVFVSDLVHLEAAYGDEVAAKRRMTLIEVFEVLEETDGVRDLADTYLREIPLAPKAAADSLHLALAAFHQTDFLLSWNCRHIANGFVRRRLTEINREVGIHSPTICTPEELLYEDEDVD